MVVGDLEIRLRADIARLQQDLNGARREVGGAMQNITRAVNFAKAAFIGLAGALLGRELFTMVSEVRQAAVDIERMAAMAGSTTDEFQRFAAGSATVGIEMDKFSDIVKDVQDRIGDFLVTGGGEMTDFFEKIAPSVGVTIAQFKNLSGPQAMQLYYSTIERANLGQEVMIQQMESLASDASMLAPLLANGGAAFQRIGADAEKAGFIMSGSLINASKIWATEIKAMQMQVGGIGRTISEFIIPELAAMSIIVRENITTGFQAVSKWVDDNREQLIGAWTSAKALGTEVWNTVSAAAGLLVLVGKLAVEMGALKIIFEAIGLMVAGFQDGVKIIAAAFASVGADIFDTIIRPAQMSIAAIGRLQGFLGRGESAAYYANAAAEMGSMTAGARDFSDGIIQEFLRGESAVQKFEANLGKTQTAVLGLAPTTRDALDALGDGSGAMAKSAADAAAAATAAAAQAKKMMESDLADIKANSEAALGIYTRAESIMESVRAGGLIDDAEYYASKLGFINLTAMAQESALVDQIARLEREKLAGDDKIEHDRKIAEARAGLSQVLADAVVARIINGNEEANANRMVAQSYADSKTAAETYLATVARQNDREIAGIGKGTEFRDYQSGINTIEDTQTRARQDLERAKSHKEITQAQFDDDLAIANDTYAKEVAAYEEKTGKIKAKQGDWLNGATEAFANYQTNAKNVAGNSAAAFTSAFEGMTDGFANSVTASLLHAENFQEGMKAVALNVVESFIQAFIKIAIQQLFTEQAMTTATAAGTTARAAIESAASIKSMALWAFTAAKNILVSAWEAMAGAYKAIAGIPIVGPFLAPVAAGAAFVAVSALAKNVASAEGGYDIPAGVNPMTQLHQKEMVLPRAQADVIRNMASEGGTKSGAITIINQTSARIGQVTETKLSNGDRALIIQEATQSAVAATNAQMSDPNSKTSRAMSRNFSIPRSR